MDDDDDDAGRVESCLWTEGRAKGVPTIMGDQRRLWVTNDYGSPPNVLDADMNDASDDVDDASGDETDGCDECEYVGIGPSPKGVFVAATVEVELELEFEVKLGMLLFPDDDEASFLPPPAVVDCTDPDPDASALFRLLLSLMCICC